MELKRLIIQEANNGYIVECQNLGRLVKSEQQSVFVDIKSLQEALPMLLQPALDTP